MNAADSIERPPTDERAASEEEITMRLAAWLRKRPGATLGDAEGIGRVDLP